MFCDKEIYGYGISTLSCYCQLSEISVLKTEIELQHALDTQEAIF